MADRGGGSRLAIADSSRRAPTWGLGRCNCPRYTRSTTFETLLFTPGLTPNIPASDYYAAGSRVIAVALVAVAAGSHAAEQGDADAKTIHPLAREGLQRRAPGAATGPPDRRASDDFGPCIILTDNYPSRSIRGPGSGSPPCRSRRR